MEQNNNTRRVISLLVDNSNGVLARISSLLCRRGFNGKVRLYQRFYTTG